MIRNNRWLILILLIAGTLYISNMFLNSLSPDEAYYLWQSQNLNFEDREPVVKLITIFFDMFLPHEYAFRFTVICFALFGIFMTYLIGKRLRNEQTGLIAAGFLAISPWYWMLSERALLDIPLTAMIALNIYMLINLEQTKSVKYAIISVITFMLALLTKNPGIMMLPVNIFFIGFAYRKKFSLKGTALFSVSVVFLMSTVYWLFDDLILKYSKKVAYDQIKSNYLVFNNVYDIVLGFIPGSLYPILYLFTAILLGIMVYIIHKKQQYYSYLILFIWIAAVFGFRLFFGGSHIIRYVLPALPAIILLLTMTIYDVNKSFRIKLPKYVIVLVISLIALLLLFQSYHINKFTSYSKTGFRETGYWLGDNAIDMPIYSGNPSQIRYYSGHNYEEHGGIIWTRHMFIGIPGTTNEFENISNAFLQIDFREKYQPDWVYPNITNAQLIHELGFQVAHVVYRNQPFYMAPPTKDKTEFLEFWNITPYTINEGKNRIFPPGIEAYSGISDNGTYLEELGFQKAESIWDYAKFALTFDDTNIEQPVVMIYCSGCTI